MLILTFAMSMYKGHRDKIKGEQDKGQRVWMPGVGGSGGGIMGQLYLNNKNKNDNNKEKAKIIIIPILKDIRKASKNCGNNKNLQIQIIKMCTLTFVPTQSNNFNLTFKVITREESKKIKTKCSTYIKK